MKLSESIVEDAALIEKLPAAEDIKKVERRLGTEAKKISKSVGPLDAFPTTHDDES